MALTKEHRIVILLGIDAAFFFLELIVGYSVHSLALVADAFHMLNDVLSLCVGLWAVRAAKTGRSKAYTYGLQRAETLGALINSVFLVALCMSIFLDAIQRFVEPQVVSNPKLVLIVGCLGLASNILGLLLFHDHGHSHGDDHGHDHAGHSHSHNEVRNAEEGHTHVHSKSHSHNHKHEHSHKHGDDEHTPLLNNGKNKDFTASDEENTTVSARSSDTHRKSAGNGGNVAVGHRRRQSAFGSVDNIPVHPASMRQEFVRIAQIDDSSEHDSEVAVDVSESDVSGSGSGSGHRHGVHQHGTPKQSHARHHHAKPKKEKSSGGGGHGHSHADLNMRGVFLHVMGDALGNIGVIATALIIWLTEWSFRYYFDPAISLVITAIILTSAIPLCKAASRILLQAVPVDIDIDEILEDIETLHGIVSAHDLHVWQLSGTKLVASIHVKVDCEMGGAGGKTYMRLAREIQECLHEYGIHSSTIQPEFITSQDVLAFEEQAAAEAESHPTTSKAASKLGSKAPSLASAKDACMLDCEDDCDSKGQCCPPAVQPTTQNNGKSRK